MRTRWIRRRWRRILEKEEGQRGSSSVFLLIVLASMVSLAVMYVTAAGLASDRASVDGAYYLAGRSVLAGYDRDLKEEYGIIAFAGDERTCTDLIENYASYTVDQLPYGRATATVDLSSYSLRDPARFQEEITGYTKYAVVRSLIRERDPGEDGAPIDTSSKRVLRNEKILLSLPSDSLSGTGALWKLVQQGLPSIDEMFRHGADDLLTEVYISAMFKNAQDDIPEKETFYRCEQEYILHGDPSEEKNRKAVRNELLLLRNGIDVVFLFEDPEKRHELEAAAEVLAPGPAGAAVMVVLAEVWALAEAENDVRILEHGKKLPLFKTPDNWATDLDSVLDSKDDYIDVDSETGFVYRDYLKMFLFVMDEETKLVRMMDLIQINMQGSRDASFLIADHHLGLDLSVDNGLGVTRYSHEY